MAVYYNDAAPAACAWLRELIAAGLLPHGEVDERSILYVEPADLRGFAQCHFFAGIGGWPYALRLAGVAEDRPVWTGSPPCQPFSQAGKRKGQDDDRHLAPAFLRLVAADLLQRPVLPVAEIKLQQALVRREIVGLEPAFAADDAHRFPRAGEGAGHEVEVVHRAAQRQAQIPPVALGLHPAERVQRRIDLALYAALRIPVGLAMAA